MSKNKAQSQNNTDHITSYKTLYAIFQVTGIIIVCSVCYWIVHFRGGFSFTVPKIIFNWHALLMTIAFIYLLANSILHYRTFRNNKKQNLKNQHAICNGSIIVLVVLAGCAALVSHLYASPPIPNFYSLHSWFGVITIVIYLIQYISGFLFFLYPGVTVQYREALASYHVFFGIFNFVLAVITAVLGFNEKVIFVLDKEYQTYPAEGLFINCLGLLCMFYVGLVVYMVTKPEFKRSPKPEYDPLL